MDRRLYKVIKGYSHLTNGEKEEFHKIIDNLKDNDQSGWELKLKELDEKLGILDTDSCPCCGQFK